MENASPHHPINPPLLPSNDQLMSEPSPHYQTHPHLHPKEEIMSPSFPINSFPPSDPFSHLYSQSSPSLQHQVYMNWGPSISSLHPQFFTDFSMSMAYGYNQFPTPIPSCMYSQNVPSDPFPSSQIMNTIGNEHVSPTGEEKAESISPINQRKRRSKQDNTQKRTIFNSNQLHALNALYDIVNNLNKPEREELGIAIGLTQTQIKIWLQNRRYKCKKMSSQVVEVMKKENYDEEKAKAAVWRAINEYNSYVATSMNSYY